MPKLDDRGYQSAYDAYFSGAAESSCVQSNREISARLASAQFVIAAHAVAEPRPAVNGRDVDARTPTIPLVRSLAIAPQSALMLKAAPVPAIEAHAASLADEPEPGLPATWYNRKPAEPRRMLSPERHALLVRSAAAACLTLSAGLFFWLSTADRQHPKAPGAPSAAALSASLISNWAPPTAITSGNSTSHTDTPSQDQISTAQILAVAERFIATGDVLAARAMLQERAGLGEPRALFALAETYDPHLLASWDEKTAEASVTYARFLYEAARRGGIAEAKTRLDALR